MTNILIQDLNGCLYDLILLEHFMFGTILICVVTFMHGYVFWRVASTPLVEKYIPLKIWIGTGIFIWLAFVAARFFGHGKEGFFSGWLELLGMNWLAILFLLFVPLICVDLVTLWGWILPGWAQVLRQAALSVGIIFVVIALIQGIRAPVVEKFEVALAGLPDELDKTVVVGLSDMHIGPQLGEKWLAARIDQVNSLNPDMVFLIGDIYEGSGVSEEKMLEWFGKIRAPLGVWAVPGNHEFYHGIDMETYQSDRFKALINRSALVKPGLVLAGVEDLTVNKWRRRNASSVHPIDQALENRPPGVVVLLSHSPLDAQKAAKGGAGLMLSGHTHGGQIWPFGYLVKKRYPLYEGRYEVDGMTVIVCRGTGTWGPRMRLWKPGQILHITLRKKS